MKITYDPEVDALYIQFRHLADGTGRCRELSDELTADYDSEGKLAGIEVLDASVVLGDELQRMIVEVSPVLTKKTA